MSPQITQLLEPSNLLEPLDLTAGFTDSSPRVETRGGAQPRPARETVGLPRPSESERRSGFKPILMVAAAVACFGAGTLLSHLQSLTREEVGIGSSAANLRAPAAALPDTAAKSDGSNSPEAPSASLGASQSKPDAPLNTTAAAPPSPNAGAGNTAAVSQSAAPVATPKPAANDVTVGCAGPCSQQACPPNDANCLEGGAPSRAKALMNADGSAANPTPPTQPSRAAKPQSAESERADTRTTSQQEERTHSPRAGKRSAQRERVDQPVVAKRGAAATVSRSSRGQNANQRRDMASGDSSPRWQDRELNQVSNGWRDRTAERRWQERDGSTWQRDRYYDYARERSPRVTRDDYFLMGGFRYRW